MTGKRVLTASTTLALAAVGLAAMPMAAHAAPVSVPTLVSACGAADTLLLPAGSPLTRYSVDAAKTIKTLPAHTTDADGNRVYKLTDLGALVDADGDPKTARTFTANFNLYSATDPTPTAVADLTPAITDEICTVIVGANNDAPPKMEVAAPKLPEVAGTVGGQLTLEYQKGAQWTVTSDGVTTVYGESAFGTAPVADKVTKTFTVTGKNTTVTLQPVDPGIVTSPTPLSWTFFNDGLTDITPPSAPTQVAGAVTLQDAPAGTAWYVTDNTVTDPAAAKLVGVPSTDPNAKKLEAGETKKYWLIVTDSTQAFADGTTSKVWSLSYSSAMTTLETKATDIVWADNTGFDNDSFTVPTAAGITFYYVQNNASGTPSTAFDAANPTAGGWALAPQGTPVKVNTPTTPYVHIAAVLKDGTTTQFDVKGWKNADETAELTAPAGPAYVGYKFTGLTTVTPGAPAVNDANLADSDTFTFPVAVEGVEYTITANDGTAARNLVAPVAPATYASLYGGKTFTRAQWAGIFTSLDTSKSVTFSVSAAIAAANTATHQLAPTATKSWTLTASVGAVVTAPAPIFSENTGPSDKPDQVLISVPKDNSVTYVVSTWSDTSGDGIPDPGELTPVTADQGTPSTDGVTKYSLAELATTGAAVVVVATPVGGRLSNADPDVTTKTWTYQFAKGQMASVPTPIKDNQPGTDKDTYTLPGATGIQWYVDNVAFDMAKVNIPQSAANKSVITVIAKPLAGYAFADGKTYESFTLDFAQDPTPTTPVVTNAIIQGAANPSSAFTWAMSGATSYTVTYQKINADGTAGPVLPWLTDTTLTGATFVAMPGDHYRIFVTAKDAAGKVSDAASSDVTFPGTTAPSGLSDLSPSTATFVGSWVDLRNVAPLPYFNNSAMIGYNGYATLTVPAGTKTFELYGTVFGAGGYGTLQVNGVNWANFSSNGTMAQPYQVMLRRLNLPDTGMPITIRIIAANGPGQYLALDAYKVSS